MKREVAGLSELDSVDRALLVELQKDARQTNKALAAKVGVAPSTCLERVRELRARGVVGHLAPAPPRTRRTLGSGRVAPASPDASS